MTVSWKLYADAGLTVEIDPIAFAHAQGGSGNDRRIWLGSVAEGKQLQRGSAPGIDAVELSLYDSAAGSGLAVSAYTLALTAGGLATNTPGAALAVGTTLLSGVGNAIPIYIRAHDAAAAIAVYNDLKLRLLGVIEGEVV